MKNIVFSGILLITVFISIIPLFHKGYFPVHDDEQVGRLIEMDTAVRDLQLPPRWTPRLGFGYGYPLFNFYPPFIYYLGEMFRILGFTYITSIKIVYILGFFFAAYFMFLLGKELFGRWGGFVSATLYTYAPYHAVDAYVRGALSEFFAFVWFPLITYSLIKLTKTKDKKYLLYSSVTLALLMITHNLTMLIFVPFVGLFLTYYVCFCDFADRRKMLRNYLVILFLSLGVSAYFWLPSLVEKGYTLVDKILTSELANFRLHFVYLRQLWSSPWGYGGSVPGPNDGMSFQIGKLHIILSAVTIAIILIKRKINKTTGTILVLALLSILSAFMTLSFSKPIWELIQPLWYLQFPWRFLSVSIFFISLIGAGLITEIKHPFFKPLLAVTLMILTVFYYKNLFNPQQYLNIDDNFYNSKEGLEWRVSRMSYEYVPRNVKTILSPEGTTILPISQKDIPKDKFIFANGKGEILSATVKSNSYNLTLKADTISEVKFSTYNFPGWEAFIDGVKTKITSDNDLQLITVKDIPTGEHNLKVVFNNTIPRTMGNLISILSLSVLVVLSRRYRIGK